MYRQTDKEALKATEKVKDMTKMIKTIMILKLRSLKKERGRTSQII